VGGEAPRPEIGGQIVFVCYAPGNNGSLYLLDVSTGKVRPLTPDSAWNVDPAWSPDGRQIAYQTTRDGRDNVYIMDVESGDVRRLTDGRGFSGYPSWSPDGRWIAFDSSRDGIEAPPNPPGYYRTIYLIRPDGTGLHRLLTFNDVSSGPAGSMSICTRGSPAWNRETGSSRVVSIRASISRWLGSSRSTSSTRNASRE